MPQREDLFDQRRVVPAARVGSAIRCARDPRRIELAAQRLVLRVREHGLVSRRIENEHPAAVPAASAALRARSTVVAGSPARSVPVVDRLRERLGRIEHVLVELRLRERKPFHHLAKTLFAVLRQRDTGQPEIAQRVLEQLALRRGKRRSFALEQPPIRGAERVVLRELGVIGGQQRQAGVVGGAQLRSVQDRVQVADRRPDAREPVMHALDRHDELVPARRIRREQGGELAHGSRRAARRTAGSICAGSMI